MARIDHFSGVVMHCIVDQKPIPPERKKDAITCSPECTKTRKNYLRSLQDQKECRYCLRPSTPEERKRYQRWRRAEERNPPAEETLSKAELQEREFGKETVKALRAQVRFLKRRLALLEGRPVEDEEDVNSDAQ